MSAEGLEPATNGLKGPAEKLNLELLTSILPGSDVRLSITPTFPGWFIFAGKLVDTFQTDRNLHEQICPKTR